MPKRLLTGVIAAAAIAGGCYSTGNGTSPPGAIFYFPVGLAVSRGGNVLYAVNSDFDLQWNGGTLQSYDLHAIRQDALRVIADPTDPNIDWVWPLQKDVPHGACPNAPPLQKPDGSGTRLLPGYTCAPPVDSTHYVRDSAIIGAFATDLQLSVDGKRLFAPVRGDATLTWADVAVDDPNVAPTDNYAPFALDCGLRLANRCDAGHHAGSDPNEPGNTRHVTMPGEPFGMAQSEDGTVIAITHQNDTKASLFTTGIGGASGQGQPALAYVLDGLPTGGNGIAAVPHDPLAFPDCGVNGSTDCLPRPAFLETSRNVAELDLLRYYSDDGYTPIPNPAVSRPFLVKEAAFTLTATASGTDSRGIVIDPTPRRACELAIADSDPDKAAKLVACARKPARVFFSNRTPAAMLVGEIGEPSPQGDGTYDPDRLVVYRSVPLPFGPSRLYLAPIVDARGNYALRVFIVCFDAASIVVYDPDADMVENIVSVGRGPFAMAFDPFSWDDVARRAAVPTDPRDGGNVKAFRFGYVASFTDSFVQLVDLDDSLPSKDTFERVVFTLGNPTKPKGTQ